MVSGGAFDWCHVTLPLCWSRGLVGRRFRLWNSARFNTFVCSRYFQTSWLWEKNKLIRSMNSFLAGFLTFCQSVYVDDLFSHRWWCVLFHVLVCLSLSCQVQVLFLVPSLWVNASWSVLTARWRGGVCRVEVGFLRPCVHLWVRHSLSCVHGVSSKMHCGVVGSDGDATAC